MIQVGLIGSGLIARSHAHQLYSVAEAEIVACYDTDFERAKSFAEDFGGTARNSADEVIDASDAVYVCTWTSAHPDLVAKVVAAEKPIFCEKPLATTLAAAQQMTDAVRLAGVTNQVGLVLRHSPAFRWLQHQALDQTFGSTMSLVFRDDQYIPIQGMYKSSWRSDPERAGAGTLIEHSVHDLDLITWMLGPIKAVSCHTANHHGITGIEDQATVTLTAESGAHAVLVSVWHDVLTRPSQRRVELFKTGGVFGLEGDWNGPVTAEPAHGESIWVSGGELTQIANGLDGLNTNPDADFIASVIAGESAYPDFSLALQAHRIVDAAYRSAEVAGQPMTLL